ncbi:hypothetical protein EMGBS4_05600 [Acidimicrobiaceae bacterium]|nr:hypothetical protein EMGBS4_05600 [Acidimicrobiaceae bacterium]
MHLVESLRSGSATTTPGDLFAESARADVEEVSEGVLQSAMRRVVDGAQMIYELTREIVNRSSTLVHNVVGARSKIVCETGKQFLERGFEDD